MYALHFINTRDINDLTFDYYWKQLNYVYALRVCDGCVYSDSFVLDKSRSLLVTLHVHRIEIAYGAFPVRVGSQITLEKVINSLVKKRTILQSKTSRFSGKRGSRIEDRGSRIEDRGSRIEDRFEKNRK